jgi:hypothetical protein
LQVTKYCYITSYLVLATAALVAEMLPEVKAKMIVIPVLQLIIETCTIDVYRLRKDRYVSIPTTTLS